MRLWSDGITESTQIHAKHTRDGDNVSPPVRWKDVPEGTRELALVMENVTPSTRKPFVQWVLYGISPDRECLSEGLQHKQDPEAPPEAVHGTNDIGNVGYDGPLGTSGRTYRYRLRLLALDEPLDIAPATPADELMKAASGRCLAQAELEFRHQRPR